MAELIDEAKLIKAKSLIRPLKKLSLEDLTKIGQKLGKLNLNFESRDAKINISSLQYYISIHDKKSNDIKKNLIGTILKTANMIIFLDEEGYL